MKRLLFILMIIGVFLISGCANDQVDTSGDDEFIDCPEDVGDFCIEIYQPVCGDDGETYSNSCFACQKVDRYTEGEC